MKWMHGFYPEHPIPRTVTLEQCIAYYDTIPVDYIFNLVYPIRDDETEVVNRFNFELHQRHPWIIPFGWPPRGRRRQGGDRRAPRQRVARDDPRLLEGTLVEIYQTMDRVGLGESVRERLVGGTA